MDVDEDTRTIGARLRQIRKSRRKSLVVVAGLAGMSKSQLSRIERGEIALDRRSEIVALANALGISPSEVTRLPMPTPGNGDVDAGVKALRLTIQRVSFESPGGHVVPVEALRERVHSVLAAQSRCEDQAVGAALPALVADLHTSIAAGRDVAQLLSMTVLVHVKGTRGWLGSAGTNDDLCFDAVRLGREAARELGEPAALAVAAFGSANGLIASGDFDLARIELDRLDLAPTNPATEQLAGLLAVTRSLLAAARKEPNEVDGPLEMAAELAERTGERNAYYMGFGPASVGVWRMSVALESGDHSRAAAVAETIRPESLATPHRRADYWVGYGRALARLRGRQDEAVLAFRRAEKISSSKVLRNSFARDVIGELLARSRRDSPAERELRGMAYRAGLPV
ncbi:MAG: helix-turn-helix domain-containing protein [Pseudonocardiaceae bacterium]